MVLIFHDEFLQSNEREREMRGSKKGREEIDSERERERENPGGILLPSLPWAFSVLEEF